MQLRVCGKVTYRVEYPWRTVPSWGIEDSPQVEEEHGSNTTAIHTLLLPGFRIGHLDICPNHPQADRATQTPDKKKHPSSHTINQVEKPDECRDRLDDTKNTGSKQSAVVAFQANTLEDSGTVVIDRVDTGPVLPEEEHAAKEEAIHDLLIGAGSFERLPKSHANGRALLL